MPTGKFQDRVEARIHLNGKRVSVDPDPIYIKRRGTIEWICDAGEWEVVMEGTSPIQGGSKLGGGKGQSKSDKARNDGNKTGGPGDPDSPKGTHKYTARVKGPSGWEEEDPEVVVGPEEIGGGG